MDAHPLVNAEDEEPAPEVPAAGVGQPLVEAVEQGGNVDDAVAPAIPPAAPAVPPYVHAVPGPEHPELEPKIKKIFGDLWPLIECSRGMFTPSGAIIESLSLHNRRLFNSICGPLINSIATPPNDQQPV